MAKLVGSGQYRRSLLQEECPTWPNLERNEMNRSGREGRKGNAGCLLVRQKHVRSTSSQSKIGLGKLVVV